MIFCNKTFSPSTYNAHTHTYIYIWLAGGFWVQLFGGRGPALLSFLFYVNVSGMRPQSRLSSQPLTIPAPWVILYVGLSIFVVPPWVTASRFLAENREVELKPTTFSTFTFPCFLSFLFSLLPSDMVLLNAASWGQSFRIYIYIYIYIYI